MFTLSLCKVRNDFGIGESPSVPRFVPGRIEACSEKVGTKDIGNNILSRKTESVCE